jgi:hypothetical protein
MATKNRLNLDFALSTTEERTQFVNEYLTRSEFIQKPLTSDEIETISNYILWGKDPNTQKNVKQEKLIELESRSKTWDSKTVDSLDAILESPTVHESQFKELGANSYKSKKITFSREEALQQAPPHILEVLKGLWRQIDEIDLTINYYDLAHNKRKNPPRPELLNQFTPSEQQLLQEHSASLNQFKYLKLRHLLVELRREQFTLRDSYSCTIQRHSIEHFSPDPTTFFDADIEVFPLGLTSNSSYLQKIFNTARMPEPADFSSEELARISTLIWSRPANKPKHYFDFREIEHLYNVFLMLDDIEDYLEKNNDNSESTLLFFLKTIRFYVDIADLTEVQREILNLKIKKVTNQDIAIYINKKYNKTYNDNYISTIFRQKILTKIAETVTLHEEIVKNLFFEENFKKCRDCGRVLLLHSNNFVKKAKSKDGYAIRCKKCEKEKRQRSK